MRTDGNGSEWTVASERGERVRIPNQRSLFPGRVLVWFSCGVTSACAAKLAVEKYTDAEVLYCDTLKYEHPDNFRFMSAIALWLGKGIKMIRNGKYADIFDVFDKTGWLVGPGGARCTNELKRTPREVYQWPGDVHVFGFSADEKKRATLFEENNPELYLWFPLIEAEITKADCKKMLETAGIELPAMYKLGYKNNNCIGCVKGKKGYWNKVRRDFPEAFARMAAQERKMGARILDVYLDELDPTAGHYVSEVDVECGPACSIAPPHSPHPSKTTPG